MFLYEDMLLSQPLPVTAGCAHPLDGPGLGVELDPQKVDKYRVR